MRFQAMVFGKDGGYVCSEEGVHRFDLSNGIAPAHIAVRARTLALSPNGAELALGNDEFVGRGSIRALPSGELLRPLTLPKAKKRDDDPIAPTAMAYSPDGVHLFTACGIGQAWKGKGGKATASAKLDANIYGIDVSPDGTVVATGGWDGVVAFWDAPKLSARGQLSLGEIAEVAIVTRDHLAMLGDLPLEQRELAIAKGELGESAMLPGNRREFRLVGENDRVNERPFECLEPGELLLEIATNTAEGGVSHGSGRPAARRCDTRGVWPSAGRTLLLRRPGPRRPSSSSDSRSPRPRTST
jgi:WD40 repeat protein